MLCSSLRAGTRIDTRGAGAGLPERASRRSAARLESAISRTTPIKNATPARCWGRKPVTMLALPVGRRSAGSPREPRQHRPGDQTRLAEVGGPRPLAEHIVAVAPDARQDGPVNLQAAH